MKLEIDNETIEMCKRVHLTNVKIRIDGQYIELETDWIKHINATEDY